MTNALKSSGDLDGQFSVYGCVFPSRLGSQEPAICCMASVNAYVDVPDKGQQSILVP